MNIFKVIGLWLIVFGVEPIYAANLNHQRLVAADQESQNWLLHGRTYDEQRYSPLEQINEKNIDQLGLAWSFDTDYNRGLEATPIVVDGVMYSTGNWSVVYANDAATGKLLWKHDPQVNKEWGVYACCDIVNRGVAVWENKVFVGTLDGYLVAMDINTGQELWRTLTIDQNEPYTITGAPRVIKGKVIIGNGGAEYGVRGYVSAYDADTGEKVWRFYTVPAADLALDGEASDEVMKMAAKTWSGEQWQEYGGGGTVWDSMAYDPELNQLYIGVGNSGPWNRQLRNPEGLDNLFVSSIVSLNPDTGAYNWHYQETPNDGWDYTATQHMILADINWQGKMRSVIMQAPKNGFFFLIDRKTGEFLSAEPYANVNWALGYDDKGRPIENPEKNYRKGKQMIRPAPFGAHNWQPMSFNQKTGLVYIPVIDGVYEYDPDPDYKKKQGIWNVGMKSMKNAPGEPLFKATMSRQIIRGGLLAWDPAQQKAVWSLWHPNMWNGGLMSTAGNLLFQGNVEQELVAYRASNGEKLWSFPAQMGIIAPPITYKVNGEQYIAVQVGWGGAFGLVGSLEPLPGAKYSRILAFKLDGKAQLPPLPPIGTKYDPPPRVTASEEALTAGGKIYNDYCMACHGMDLISNKVVPDLRFMHKSRHAAFKDIVLHGALKKRGMVGFSHLISDKEADDLYAYILNEANNEKDRRDNPQPEWWIEIKTFAYKKLGAFIRWVM